MPQCGLAHGFIGIVAHHLAQGFETLHEIKMRVGALPAFPTNALKYTPTWSVDGLINEYCHPCEAIRDGQNIDVLPLEGLEHFSLDGTEYEAFNTSGGLGTLCETLAGRVEHLSYKTIRYPGHCERIRLLMDLGLFDERPVRVGGAEVLPRELIEALFAERLSFGDDDAVLVRVTARGVKDGRERTLTHTTATSRTTPTPLWWMEYGLLNLSLSLDRPIRLGGRGFGVRGSVGVNNLLDAAHIGSAFLNPDLVNGVPVAYEPGLPRNLTVSISVGWQ